MMAIDQGMANIQALLDMVDEIVVGYQLEEPLPVALTAELPLARLLGARLVAASRGYLRYKGVSLAEVLGQ
jgi:hypothetical protein